MNYVYHSYNKINNDEKFLKLTNASEHAMVRQYQTQRQIGINVDDMIKVEFNSNMSG